MPASVRYPGLRRLVTVAIDIGRRQGEELGLRWQDVDFEGLRLWVRTTLHLVGGAYLLGRPKSETSDREVALSEFTLRALKDEGAAHGPPRRPLALGGGRSSPAWCSPPPWGRPETAPV
ncbi:MAG: site-specific integrase [Candidatus Dormibacteria bacterium]